MSQTDSDRNPNMINHEEPMTPLSTRSKVKIILHLHLKHHTSPISEPYGVSFDTCIPLISHREQNATMTFGIKGHDHIGRTVGDGVEESSQNLTPKWLLKPCLVLYYTPMCLLYTHAYSCDLLFDTAM